MIAEFFSWWGRQLLECLPAALRRDPDASAAADGVVVTLEGAWDGRGALEARRRRGRRVVALGRFSADAAGLLALRRTLGKAGAGDVTLEVPGAMLLEQQVTLPLAAESGLETALRWEMDRLTPFPAEAVFWSYAVEERDRARGRLGVRLRLVPKAAVAGAIAALVGGGLGPARLAAAGSPGRVIALQQRRRPALRVSAIASAVFVVLAAGAVAAPFVRQEIALRQLAEAAEALRPDVTRAEALRRRMADRAANADVMAAEAQRVGDALQAVALATTLLPDDTYLLGFSLRERVMTLTGQSGSASRLIGILARDPAIKDPSFAAPVTRNEVNGTEAFTLRATVQ